MNREFDQLVETEGLEPEEQMRLRRVHEMLLLAGPPPELPVALQAPPAEPDARTGEGGGTLIAFPGLRRRPVAALLIAASLAAACFGGGYLLANEAHPSSINAIRVVSLVPTGTRNSEASLRVGAADSDGNWPIQLTVNGLPALKNPRAYYILMLMRNGKPVSPCGEFKVTNGSTTVRFSVPYKITGGTRWVVTAMTPGIQWPGHVVMTTS